jgi:hypothetical protein
MIDMGTVHDLTGRTFGRLRVVSRGSNSNAGKARWRCSCRCGEESLVVASDLRSGRIVSCGCWRREQNRKHGRRGPSLIGKRYGKLTVISAAGKDRHGHNQWLCRCDCGRERVAVSGGLPSTKSCGCARKGIPWHVTPARLAFKNLVGQRFGRLIVIEGLRRGDGRPRWRCQCDCGNKHTTSAAELKRGSTASCGCLARDIASQREHPGKAQSGRSNASIAGYTSWCMMRTRCTNPEYPDYPNYGGRGISVCERWLGVRGFANFFADMGEKPPGMSLDRIDPNGNYEPSNCRWATAKQQKNNQRLSRDRVAALLAEMKAASADLLEHAVLDRVRIALLG